MKKWFKKAIGIVATALILTVGCVCFFACGMVEGNAKQAKAANPAYEETVTFFCPLWTGVEDVYDGNKPEGTIPLDQLTQDGVSFPGDIWSLSWRYPREVVSYSDPEEIALIQKYKQKEVSLKDVSALDADVHYVLPGEAGVVVSKWLYYYSALWYYAAESEDPSGMEKTCYYDPATLKTNEKGEWINPSYFRHYFCDTVYVSYDNARMVLEDEYCMEHVVTDIWTYKGYDGKSMRELTAEEREAVEPTWYECYRNSEFFSCYPLEAIVAALARYGAIDTTLSKPVGYLHLGSLWLRVVGYYETEADKLLSTGVSMDENSDEYKLVMEQLSNTVIYSNCGNFADLTRQSCRIA